MAQRRKHNVSPRLSAGRIAKSAHTEVVGALTVNHIDNTVSVDVQKLEAPGQVYDADFAWVEHREGQVSLVFGKRGASRNSPVSTRLEIRYPVEMLRSSFWKNSEDFVAKMRKYVALWPLAARERDRSQREMREKGAERAHSDWANFSYMSHSGTEASFDFYHLSTSARARFGSLRDLQHMRMRAVARVQTSVFTMAHLIDDVEEVVKAIGAYLPSRADQDDADAEIPPAEVRRG